MVPYPPPWPRSPCYGKRSIRTHVPHVCDAKNASFCTLQGKGSVLKCEVCRDVSEHHLERENPRKSGLNIKEWQTRIQLHVLITTASLSWDNYLNCASQNKLSQGWGGLRGAGLVFQRMRLAPQGDGGHVAGKPTWGSRVCVCVSGRGQPYGPTASRPYLGRGAGRGNQIAAIRP